MLLDNSHDCGTVKVIDESRMSEMEKENEKNLQKWIVCKELKLWKMESKTVQKEKKEQQNDQTIAVDKNQSKNESVKIVKSVKSLNSCEKQRTLVSAKKMDKILKAGEEVFWQCSSQARSSNQVRLPKQSYNS